MLNIKRLVTVLSRKADNKWLIVLPLLIQGKVRHRVVRLASDACVAHLNAELVLNLGPGVVTRETAEVSLLIELLSITYEEHQVPQISSLLHSFFFFFPLNINGTHRTFSVGTKCFRHEIS